MEIHAAIRCLSVLVVGLAMMGTLPYARTTEASASDPSCARIGLTNIGTSPKPVVVVSWACNISNFYSKPTCQFKYFRNQTSSSNIVPAKYIQETDSVARNGKNFDHSCFMSLPVTTLNRDGYKFRVTILPQVIRSSPIMEKEVISDNLDLSIQSIVCDKPIHKDQVIIIECRISSPYDKISCRLQISKDGSPFIAASARESRRDPSCSGKPLRCSNRCSLTMDKTSMGDASFRLRVKAVVEHENRQEKFPIAISKPSDEITITSGRPIAALGDCPQDYIRAGTTKTCQCYLTFKGNPPGVPLWMHSNGNPAPQLDGGNGYSTLSLQYRHDKSDPTYYCAGNSTLGMGPKIDYKPKFAYGPTHVLIVVNKHIQTFSLCEGNSATFKIFCDIEKRSTNPQPKISVKGSLKVINQEEFNNNNLDYYRSVFRIQPAIEGPLKLTCVATNPVFPDMTVENSKIVTILTPPSLLRLSFSNSPPYNTSTVKVTSGHKYLVKCSTDGGYPPKSQAIITCPEHVSVNGKNQLELNVDRSMDGKKCSCQVSHRSGCYQKKIEVTLAVNYKPEVIYFNVNSKYTNRLEINANEVVEFECISNGNPKPNIAIRGQRSKNYLTGTTKRSQHMWITVVTKSMYCQDSDIYVCDAKNDIGDAPTAKTELYVKCPPEVIMSDLDTKAKVVALGHPLIIEVSIAGYPIPNEYKVSKSQATITVPPHDGDDKDDGDDDKDDGDDSNDHLNKNKDSSNTRIKRRASVVRGTAGTVTYNVSYKEDGPGRGTVVVSMSGFQPQDNGQYLLVIKNGEGKGLNHPFTVLVTSENQTSPSGPDPGGNDGNGGNDKDDSGSGGNASAMNGVIGGVVALVIILVVVVVAIFIIRRKKNSHNNKTVKLQGEHFNNNCSRKDRDSFVEINNDIYGLDDIDNKDPYAELNEDEITSIRKESDAYTDPATYQNTGMEMCKEKRELQDDPKQIDHYDLAKSDDDVEADGGDNREMKGKMGPEYDDDYVYI